MTAVAITLVFMGGFAVGVVFCVLIDFLYGAKDTEETSSELPAPEPSDKAVEALTKLYEQYHSQNQGNN